MKRVPLVLVLLFIGCWSGQDSGVEVEAYLSLPFSEVGRGRQAVVDTVHTAIRTSDAWVVFQDSLRPLQAFAPVDFEMEMILIAALPVPTGGYDLRFEEVEDSGDTIIARYRLYAPGSDCRTTVGQGNVFQVVRLVQSEKSVTFERTEEAVDCREPG